MRVEVTERAQELQVEIEVGTVETEPAVELEQSAYGLIVNTTAVGLRGEDPFEHLPLRRDGFGPGQTVVDMVYGEAPSTLLAAAAAAGARTVDGIEILVQQGALSLAALDRARSPARRHAHRRRPERRRGIDRP